MGRYTITYTIFTVILTMSALSGRAQDGVLQFILTSDVHYGITRTHFRGADSVPANVVNQAMIAVFNKMPKLVMPKDSGVASGRKINEIDALIITGDIANREEIGIQSATDSWQQFEADYMHKVTTKDKDNKPTDLWLCAGNHDVTNAIGYLKPTKPVTDASSMAGIYNKMMSPAHPKTAADYNYNTDKIHYSKDIGGIHILFVNLWPDSVEQQWMEQDLKKIKPATPVLLFTHSMPELEARFFTNPNGQHTINNIDKFENLLPETFKDGKSIKDTAVYEERGLAAFLKRHPEVKAYFHGHNNWNEFYDWQSPDKDFSIPCFRVDSPMKGRKSAKDETRLSFQLISIDTLAKTMTVRECRWNTMPGNPAIFEWGDHKTMSLN
jgi:hypothetical protein